MKLSEISAEQPVEMALDLMALGITGPDRLHLALEVIEHRMRRHGVAVNAGTTLVDERTTPVGFAWAAVGDEHAPMTLWYGGHVDVVDADHYGGLLGGTILRGRGSRDMLLAQSAMFHTLPYWRETQVVAGGQVRVVVVAVADEESTPPHSWAGVIDQALQGVNGLTAPRFIVLGEPTDDLAIGRAGYGLFKLRVTINGPGGHSARPRKTTDSNRWMRRVADALEALPFATAVDDDGHEATLVQTIVRGGEVETAVAPSAKSVWTVRPFPGQETAAVIRQIDGMLGRVKQQIAQEQAARGIRDVENPVEWTMSAPMDPWSTREHDPGLRALVEAAEPHRGGSLCVREGGCDMSYSRGTPGGEFGLPGGLYHTPKDDPYAEWVDLRFVPAYMQILLAHPSRAVARLAAD